MEKKRYEWALFLIPVLCIFIALITPAVSYYDPVGFISLYYSGVLLLYVYGHGSVSVVITNKTIMIPSVFTLSVMVISLFTLSILMGYLRKDLKNFKVLNLRYFLFINALVLLASVITWIIQFTRVFDPFPEGLIEIGYNNIWEIFSPSFGLIGIFIAAGMILAGVIYTQLNYKKLIGKFVVLSTKTDRFNELNRVYRDILKEMDQLRSTGENHYIKGQDILNESEMRRYNHLNWMANKINSVLFKVEEHDI